MSSKTIEPFTVEEWMDKYEATCKFNIAETCAASISIQDLETLSEEKSKKISLPDKKLTYGAIRGSDELRSNLAGLYSGRAASPLAKESILISQGAISANFLVLYALLGLGDHVICHYPTYQQLYSVPASLGAEVDLWRASEDKKWQLDIEQLKGLIRSNTKMVIINNPNNPTGAVLSRPFLEGLVDICSEKNLILFSDEVYRPLFHSTSPMDPTFPPSTLNLGHSNAIVTGSMSKAYSLAGIRVGWVASRNPELISKIASARDYTTISVGQLDDAVAAYALSEHCVHALLRRNIRLAKENLAVLEGFVEKHRWACEWVKPVAGTTAFIKFSKMGREVDDVEFCRAVHDEVGVMLCPGSHCFGGGKDFKGYVRFGFCCETEVLEAGLKVLRDFMKEKFADMPLAQ